VDDATAQAIRDKIGVLYDRQPDVFGSLAHHFELNDPIGDFALAQFERDHGIRLPPDYRWFVSRVSDGGAGPYYGLFPLGQTDGPFDEVKIWFEKDGFVGTLRNPFPFTGPWNDLTGRPADELADQDQDAYYDALAKFENRYFGAIDGAIPICHMGCALRIWLVVSGPERGNLWIDRRADSDGFAPMAIHPDAPRTTFLDWYRNWMEDALTEPSADGEP
jgi:hypothetical protein